MIFTRTLAMLRLTIGENTPALPFQQLDIAAPSAFAAPLMIPGLPAAVTPAASLCPERRAAAQSVRLLSLARAAKLARRFGRSR